MGFLFRVSVVSFPLTVHSFQTCTWGNFSSFTCLFSTLHTGRSFSTSLVPSLSVCDLNDEMPAQFFTQALWALLATSKSNLNEITRHRKLPETPKIYGVFLNESFFVQIVNGIVLLYGRGGDANEITAVDSSSVVSYTRSGRRVSETTNWLNFFFYQDFSAVIHIQLKRCRPRYPVSFATRPRLPLIPAEMSTSVGGSSSHEASLRPVQIGTADPFKGYHWTGLQSSHLIETV